MVHQHFMLVHNLTVVENVMLGAERSPLLGKGIATVRAELKRLEKDHGLEVDPDAIVEDLPVGLQQRVEILKSLYRGADILILDEPTGVLTPSEADHLFAVLKELRAEGKTIILITHKLREIMAITDSVSVMRRGEMVATRKTAETSVAELAELLNEAARCGEQTIFCNSGTEATMYGMRVARAFTGKDKVAVFDGNYHGSHDYALIKAAPDSPREAPLGKILGRGVPETVNDNTMMVLPYHDEAAYGLIRAHANELALVIVQPVQNQVPRNDNAEFLHGLLDVCRECGVLMLMDEVVTGFRIGYGGGQEAYDITPDLATYGKALAGGMPIGALTGRADVMELLGLGKGDPRGVFSGGTFSGNPLTMAAGIAALRYMRDNKETIYPTLNRKSQRMADAINGFCQENQIGAQLLNSGSIFYLHFQREPIETSRDVTNTNTEAEREFYLHLMNHGVIVPGIHLFFLSDAHSDEDVDEIIEAFKQSFLDVRADGLM